MKEAAELVPFIKSMQTGSGDYHSPGSFCENNKLVMNYPAHHLQLAVINVNYYCKVTLWISRH